MTRCFFYFKSVNVSLRLLGIKKEIDNLHQYTHTHTRTHKGVIRKHGLYFETATKNLRYLSPT
jgi:hypothetical protein